MHSVSTLPQHEILSHKSATKLKGSMRLASRSFEREFFCTIVTVQFLAQTFVYKKQQRKTRRMDFDDIFLRCMHCESTEQLERFCVKWLVQVLTTPVTEENRAKVKKRLSTWKLASVAAFRTADLSQCSAQGRQSGAITFARAFEYLCQR